MLGSGAISEFPIGGAPTSAAPPPDTDITRVANAAADADGIGAGRADIAVAANAFASTSVLAPGASDATGAGSAVAVSTVNADASAVVTQAATAVATAQAIGFGVASTDTIISRAAAATATAWASAVARVDIGTIVAAVLTRVLAQVEDRSKVLDDVTRAEVAVATDAVARVRPLPLVVTASSVVIPNATASSRVLGEPPIT